MNTKIMRAAGLVLVLSALVPANATATQIAKTFSGTVTDVSIVRISVMNAASHATMRFRIAATHGLGVVQPTARPTMTTAPADSGTSTRFP